MTIVISRKAILHFKSQSNPKWDIRFECFCRPETIRDHGDLKLHELKLANRDAPKDLELHVEWFPHD